jgi:hypothetical protein
MGDVGAVFGSCGGCDIARSDASSRWISAIRCSSTSRAGSEGGGEVCGDEMGMGSVVGRSVECSCSGPVGAATTADAGERMGNAAVVD